MQACWLDPGEQISTKSETHQWFKTQSFSYQGNQFQNVICKMVAILYWPQYVNGMQQGMMSGGHYCNYYPGNFSGADKSLQLIWRLGTRRWNLRVPDLQMSCSNDKNIGHKDTGHWCQWWMPGQHGQLDLFAKQQVPPDILAILQRSNKLLTSNKL